MSECLIDFDAFPKCPNPYYDKDWDDRMDKYFCFQERYEIATEARAHKLMVAMCQRLLTEDEEIQAHNFGAELTSRDYKTLSDVWFQQRRLKALKKGLLLK